MTDELWAGKRVLVTGADGFMGSHLTEALLARGAAVSVLVRGTSVNGTSEHRFKNLPDSAVQRIEKVISCDIASPDVMALVMDNQPSIIFHLAAVAYVPFSFDHPLEVTQANVTGTVHMLEAARHLKSLERIVCTSSSEAYGTALTTRIDEDHPLNPTSPYAASKAAADRYCFSYRQTYDLPVTVLRPFNTYGPRHTYDVIPKFIRLALKDEPITIYGDGKQTRDFTYVSDTVRAFIAVASHPDTEGEILNSGTGLDVSISEIAETIQKLSGTSAEIVHIDTRAAEVQRLCCDFSKLKEMLGWQPQVSLEEGLRQNIEWARVYLN